MRFLKVLFLQKETDLENELVVARGKTGEGTGREFRMDMYTLLCLKWITNRTYCTVRGTLLSVTGQPGWEGSLGENGYMYTYGSVPSLLT